MENRIKKIMRASIVAIATNIFLAAFKAVVGILSNSVAITMDALNNFTDAGSSLITMVSARFASKEPNKKHPFGYGRSEYLGALVIAVLILYAGITAFVESVTSIIHPEVAEYSTLSLIIIIVAVIVKLALAIYTQRIGKKTNSDALVASGKEALLDVAISVATVIAAFLFLFTHFSIEAYLGVIIAIVIIKSGIETLLETVSKLLGTNADPELARNIKNTIAAHEEVLGAFDLVLHNYGPDAYVASVHIEVNEDLSMEQLDTLTRELQEEVFVQHKILLSAVGIYSVNHSNEEIVAMRNKVRKLALEDDFIHQLHGFYVNLQKKQLRFDLVISLDSPKRSETYAAAVDRIQKEFPDYQISAGMDFDYNEL